MHSQTAFALTCLVLGYAVVSGLVRQWYVAPALIFVVFGMALGPSGLGLIDVENADAESFTVLAQLALTVILFNQASRLNLRTVLGRGRLTVRLLAIGIPVSITLGTVAATVLIGRTAVVGGGLPRDRGRADRGGADRSRARRQSPAGADSHRVGGGERLLRRVRACRPAGRTGGGVRQPRSHAGPLDLVQPYERNSSRLGSVSRSARLVHSWS